MPTSLQRFLAFSDRARARLAWLGPLAVRLAVGWTFMLTGWGKLHNLEMVTQFFASLHIPAPGFHAHLVASIEFAGGILILAGLGTRWVALPLIGVMTVAIYTAKLPELHGLGDLFGTEEFVYLAVFAWLALAGAGAASLDALIERVRGRAATVARPGATATSH
ncbi:MAG: DoxX family protein [Myxococcales bacterium]|nr:DoxX family protein [Myxococcales bacterium]